jgi:hypothetical protein
MIAHQLSLPVLLPAAVTLLAADPLTEGDYYPGDLLYAVVRLPEPAWHRAANHRDRLTEVCRQPHCPLKTPTGASASPSPCFSTVPRRAQHPIT